VARAISLHEGSRAEDWRPDAALAVLVSAFVLLGITVGAQGVLWAPVLERLNVTKGVFGTAQLVSPLVSMALLLAGARVAARRGKKPPAVASLFLLGTASVALAATADLWTFIGALIVLGAGIGLFESAMNGATLDWEAATGRSVLNVVHAAFAAGAIAGALGAGALLGGGWSPAQIFLLVALITAAMLLVTVPVRYPPQQGDSTRTMRLGSTIALFGGRRALLIVAVIAMLGGISESVANIWAVIYLDERGAGIMLGGLTFAIASGTMVVGRIANAPIVARYGARSSLIASGAGLVAAAILLLVPDGVPMAVLGFAALGLVGAGVVPTALGAGAGIAPGQTAAVAGGVLAAVYVGFMIYPPIVGWLADRFSLQAAMATIGVAGLCIIGLARTLASSGAQSAIAGD
jgi:fucose permease